VVLVLTGLHSYGVLSSQEDDMEIQIETVGDITVSADAAWELFGERFGDISEWLESILASSLDREMGEGATRTCQLAGGPLTEYVTKFDAKRRALTYEVTSGLPSVMKKVENAWTFEPTNGGTRVTSVVTVEMPWFAAPMTPMVRKKLGSTMAGLIEQLGRSASDSRSSLAA
jgi:hypothetical protein